MRDVALHIDTRVYLYIHIYICLGVICNNKMFSHLFFVCTWCMCIYVVQRIRRAASTGAARSLPKNPKVKPTFSRPRNVSTFLDVSHLFYMHIFLHIRDSPDVVQLRTYHVSLWRSRPTAHLSASPVCVCIIYTRSHIANWKPEARAIFCIHFPANSRNNRPKSAKNCNSLVLRAPLASASAARMIWFTSNRGIYARTSNPDSRRSVERGKPQLMVIAVIFRGLRNFAESWILAHYYCYWR